jgi:hypothetical protein
MSNQSVYLVGCSASNFAGAAIHLHQGVADGGAGGEGDAVAGVFPVQEAGCHVEVKGPFTAACLNACDAFHFGWGFEILEVVTLVNEQVVNAQLVKDQAVVFFLCGQEVFEAFLTFGLLFLNGFNDVAVRTGRVSGGAVAQRSPPSNPSSAGCPSPATRPVRARRRGPVAYRLPTGLAAAGAGRVGSPRAGVGGKGRLIFLYPDH